MSKEIRNLFRTEKRGIFTVTGVFLILTLSFNCGVDENMKFSFLTDAFLEDSFHSSPVHATYVGAHQYDHLLDDYSPAAVQEKLEMFRGYLDKFRRVNAKRLNQTNRVDLEILINEINSSIFRFEEQKPHIKSPLMYNYLIGGAINSLITRDFAPWEERLGNLLSRLKQVPKLVEQAKQNLDNPPEVATTVAIRQSRGSINLLQQDLLRVLDNAPELKDSILAASEVAVQALKEYQEFLKEDLLARSKGDFRLGEELYREKLRLTLQSDLTPEEILDRAGREAKRVRKEMYKIALPLHKKYFPRRVHREKGEELERVIIREVLEEIGKDHPRPEELLDTIKEIMIRIEAFVKEKDFITLDESQPLVIEWTPEFSRGVAVAGLDAPGPLDKGQNTFYRVSPVPDYYTPSQVDSYLREYNYFTLEELSFHEAIPGHYVQLYYANRFPSLVRSIFGNGAFIEGWAMLAEKQMVDSGFHDYDPRLKLMHLKMYLRAVTNSILDIKLHTQDLSQEEAMKLMVEDAFQEEAEAQGKWIRACLTSCQLCTYFVGFQELNDLMEEYKKRKGNRFNLKEFNEKLLSYGSPPAKYVREELLGPEA